MTRSIFACAALACAGFSASALALPTDSDSLTKQIAICRAGTLAVVGGMSDADELQLYRDKLKENGWTSDKDFNELLNICLTYKSGFLDGAKAMKASQG